MGSPASVKVPASSVWVLRSRPVRELVTVISTRLQVVMMAAFMAAVNVGVTKTPLGSTLVVTEMAGLQVLPTTLIAAASFGASCAKKRRC